METRIEQDKRVVHSYLSWIVGQNDGNFFESSAYRALYPKKKITPQFVIETITEAYGFSDSKWVDIDCRKKEFVIPRQLLMTILSDLGGYTLGFVGGVCKRDHATVIYSKRTIHNTLWNDYLYGDKIREVYEKCERCK